MQDAGRSERPIKITIPTAINEFTFSVRDFGNSMDKEAIKNVYMRVNASTKSRNNKAIGGFGIGSKTPWAYTDMFILKTFLNGLETHYALVKGRSSVSIIYTGETTEENGTEVTFKTKGHDVKSFEEAVTRICLCAKTKPILNKKIPVEFKKEVKVNNFVSFFSNNWNKHYLYINMGGVLYRVDSDLLYNSNKPWRHNDLLDQLISHTSNSNVLLSVPVGTLMPLQTRESLFTKGEEGDLNKAVLRKLLKKALNDVKEYQEKKEAKVKDIKTAIEYFGEGLINSKSSFTYGNVIVNSSSISFKEETVISEITRQARTYRHGPLKRGRLTQSNYLNFKTLNSLDFYFSELSGGKARLVTRFHNLAAHDDIIVLEQHKMKSEDYELLKTLTNAVSIETIDIPKIVRTKGAKRDASKIVYYGTYGSRIGEIDTNNYNKTTKYLVVNKNNHLKLERFVYDLLNYRVIFVAPTNVDKLLKLEGFYSEDGIEDFTAVKEDYIKFRYDRAIRCTKSHKNSPYLTNFLTDNKKNLVNKTRAKCSYENYYAITKLLNEKYKKEIDTTVKRMVLSKVRFDNIVKKVPLLDHIDRPSFLKGQAKEDLDNYITQRLGA